MLPILTNGAAVFDGLLDYEMRHLSLYFRSILFVVEPCALRGSAADQR